MPLDRDLSPPPAGVCCSVLQHVAACCSVLQCVAAGCSVLQCFTDQLGRSCRQIAGFRLLLQVRVAVCCSVLQRVAVCCSVL